jgi:hypothetical protein
LTTRDGAPRADKTKAPTAGTEEATAAKTRRRQHSILDDIDIDGVTDNTRRRTKNQRFDKITTRKWQSSATPGPST